TWQNIKARFGLEKFAAKFGSADLVGFVNWTMLTAMSDIWAAVLKEICPDMTGPRRKLFIDLADPEKRNTEDILRALELVTAFQKYFDVMLGLNEKEGYEIGEKLGLRLGESSPENLLKLCKEIHLRIQIDTIIIHPTSYALASGPDGSFIIAGPFTPKPQITTGAGDHFNSGFCLGKLLGFPTDECLLTGVTTSGHYVRTGASPVTGDLAKMINS